MGWNFRLSGCLGKVMREGRIGVSLACLLWALGFGHAPAGAAVQDYAGIYSGTYTGADVGTWSVLCDPDGDVLALSWSNGAGSPDGGLGTVSATGHITVTTGVEGTSISAYVQPGGAVTGNWYNPYAGMGGNLSGRKSLPHELASFSGSYAGTFAGDDTGTWNAAIAADGIFTGNGWSNENAEHFEFVGFVNYSGELFAVAESDAIVHAAINSAGAFQGTWHDPEGEGGTISGTRAASVKKPTATTGSATSVSAGAATLNGTVNPNGAATSYHFEWGTSTAYGLQTAVMSAGSGTSAVAVSAAIPGLAPGTRYHFRLVAANTAGTTTGGDKFFTTAALPPTVVTAGLSSIGAFSAAGGGTVTSDGGAAVTARGVCWSTSPNPTVLANKTTDGSGAGAFLSNLSGLSPATTYHVRAYATNSAGTAYGGDEEFATQPAAPAVVTGGARVGTPQSAVLHGMVVPNGTETTYCFEYGETMAYGFSAITESAGAGTAPIAVSAAVSGLLADTTYHYRLVADNGEGQSNGADATFSTEFLYVEPGGVCGGKSPCYETIQAAMEEAGSGAMIIIAQGVFEEAPVLNISKKLTLSGGWDVGFTASTGFTTVTGLGLPPLVIENGTLVIESLILQ